MNSDLKIIKQKYGEKMAHLCRELFPTILETEGMLAKIITSNFHPDRALYESLVKYDRKHQFRDFIYDLALEKDNEIVLVDKTPQELLEEAGYILYECHNEEDIQAFKKYYASGRETLCTFLGGRLNTNHVFFAVKKNVDEIKRENFDKPERQDEYGTSVISIQFSRGTNNYLSIKNRYNSAVPDCDATFSNNLENIIEGLTGSFQQAYGFNISQNNSRFGLPGFKRAADGKWYRYNLEVDNVYYCPDNIVIKDGVVEQLDKSKYLLIDQFLLDLGSNSASIEFYKQQHHDSRAGDSFIDYYNDTALFTAPDDIVNPYHQYSLNLISKLKKVKVITTEFGKELVLTLRSGEESRIKINKSNQIIGYNNPYLKEAKARFLYENRTLQELELASLTKAGHLFLPNNKVLHHLELPMLTQTGICFLTNNLRLTILELPNLEVAGDDFLFRNMYIHTLILPSLQVAGNSFLYGNEALEELDLPKLQSVGDNFLATNGKIKCLNASNLVKVGHYFLNGNKGLEELELLNLETVGEWFLAANRNVKKFYAPSLREVDSHFMSNNRSLEVLNLPMLEQVGSNFLSNNIILRELILESLVIAGNFFIPDNRDLEVVKLPNLECVGDRFLFWHPYFDEEYFLSQNQANKEHERKLTSNPQEY